MSDASWPPADAAGSAPVTLALIASVARNGSIGKDNRLLCHLPEDQQHFRRATAGGVVIMGRKTWDSLPERFRPLPGRRNIVVTRNPQWQAGGAEAAPSLDAALACVQTAPKVFVIGGAQAYAMALPTADELVLTEIDADLPGDIFFPAWDRSRFARTALDVLQDARGITYRFTTYTRIGD